MKNLSLSLIAAIASLTVWGQGRIQKIPSQNNTFQLAIYDQNLDSELENTRSFLGKPNNESCGEMVWEGIEIPEIGENLTIKLEDGLLTVGDEKSKFKKFKKTINKNKRKECQLRCMKDGQYRQFVFTISKDGTNLINEDNLDAALKYLEKIME